MFAFSVFIPSRLWTCALWLGAFSLEATATPAPNARDRLNTLVLDEFVSATEALENRERACRTTETVLASDLLAPVRLNSEEKKVVLLYFNARANWECHRQATLELLAALHLAREAGIESLSASDDPDHLGARASLIGQFSMLRYEAQYLALPASKRAALEEIEALKWPFKLYESAEALGLRVRRL